MPPPSATSIAPSARSRESAFELRVLPREDIGYGVALYRSPAPMGRGATSASAGSEHVIRIWGDPLLGVIDHVLAAIRRGGYRSTDLRATRRAPFVLREDDGVRLGLLFAALKPLRKRRRIEEVVHAISSMELEEACYWFSKATTGPERGRACRALRIMASDE